MNRKFSVIPLLGGSLGLQMLVEDDLNPDDIDIGVPQYLYRLTERWNDLLSFMLEEGYELTDLHEHSFKKGDIEINYAALDGDGGIPSLEVFVGIDIKDISIMETDGAFYKRMALEQYLKVYLCSLEDKYRKDKTGNKDKLKIDAIQKALNYKKQARLCKNGDKRWQKGAKNGIIEARKADGSELYEPVCTG